MLSLKFLMEKDKIYLSIIGLHKLMHYLDHVWSTLGQALQTDARNTSANRKDMVPTLVKLIVMKQTMTIRW